MSARAIWKGLLRLGDDSVPVKLYSAVTDRTVHFRILEKSTLMPVKQKMLNPETGQEVSRADMKRGYELERGVYVLLSEEDLRKAEPKESRDIELTRFVPAAAISQEWYDRPYYLGPDANDSTVYFSLAQALANQKCEAIAHWVMRKKRYVGALRSEGGYLMLMTLRLAEEVISADQLPQPAGRAPDPKELKLAEQLVSALEGQFRPEDFPDEYRERLMKFIEAKAHGQHPKLKVVARKEPTQSLAANLAVSLNMAKKQKEKLIA